MNYRDHSTARHDQDEVQRRFFEMRWDGDRKLSGTALQYGDTAKLPWGDKERFEPGAFGALGNADIILNVQHDRTRPIARTGGGGLTLRDDPQELAVAADLPNTREADDTLENVKKKILRGLSVEFIPQVTERDGDVLIIKKAELRAIGVVDRPAYGRSRLNPRSKSTEANKMDEDTKKQLRELIEEALNKRADGASNADSTVTLNAAVERIATGIDPVIERAAESAAKAQVEKLIQERDEAEAKAKAAEEERAAMKKKADDDEEEMAKKKAKDDEELQKKAEERAELLLMIKPLLPADVETRTMSDHELMVKAVGDTVEKAEERSADYLMAKIETMIELRDKADTNIQNQANGQPTPIAHSANEFRAAGGPDIVKMIEMRNRATAA